MKTDNAFKRRIIRKIETLDEDKLKALYLWLGMDEEDDKDLARKKNLSLAGVWKNVPEIVLNAVLKEIYVKRKSKTL